MIIRVQSDSGTKRLEVSDSDTVAQIFELTIKAFNLDSNANWQLSKSRSASDVLRRNSRCSVKSAKLTNGDMIFLISQPVSASQQAIIVSEEQEAFQPRVTEDSVDGIIERMDGRIMRPKSQLCHHPDSGQCVHCVPLEPSDPDYLSLCDPPAKFMSFHAYLRKLRGNQGKYVRLENLNCAVRPNCLSHPPWPQGICTKCQPKPVTLDIQPYRHVDYVQFDNAQMMETFLDYWRQTGNQRIGVLLGHYAPFDTPGSPPLAVKAVVSAIYEPAQEGTNRSVRFLCPLEDILPPRVKATATSLGLKAVGWIFTDLTPEGRGNQGSVKHYRGDMETFFISAQECITAARLQNLHPNVSRDSTSGHFGSKFVTVVVTGSKDHEIHFEAYQVSNVAMALQSAGILVPTYDAPELGYIRESTKDNFVPDVFYSSKDKYGNIVTKIARPLPIEYLLVDMPAAFPVEQTFVFADLSMYNLSPRDVFPVENRHDLGQKQNIEAFSRYCSVLGREGVHACLANFHVLAWLAGQLDDLPLNEKDFADLLKTLREGRDVAAWAVDCEGWGSLELITKTMVEDTPSQLPTPSLGSSGVEMTSTANVPPVPSFRDVAIVSQSKSTSLETDGGAGGEQFWACQHCTLHNHLDSNECEMCLLPRSM